MTTKYDDTDIDTKVLRDAGSRNVNRDKAKHHGIYRRS